MNRSILSGVLSVAGSKAAILVVGLVTTPVLVRLLGIPSFGEYSFVLSAFAIFMIFVSSGVTDGVRKFIAEDRRLPDWHEHVVGFYFRLAVLFAAVGAGVLWYAADSGLVARFVGSEFTVYFYALAVLVVAAQFRSFARKTLMGFGLERYSEPLQALDTVAFVALALPLVYVGYGVVGALAARAIACILVAAIGMALIHRTASLRHVFRRTPVGFPHRSMLTFNTMTVVLVFLLTSLYHVDVVMLQAVRGSTAVGNYNIALKLAEFLWFVPITVQTVFVHSTSELWSKNRHAKITKLAARTTRYTFLLTAVMALGLAALADVVVPLYGGADATPAIAPLVLLIPGALGFAVARPILAVAQGKGDLLAPVLATGAAAGLNLLLNLALIPRYGAEGAAIATSVGYGSMFVFHIWSARSVGFDPLADARLVQIVLTTALAALPIFYLPSLVGNDLLALVVVPPIGLAIFLALAFLTGALGVGEFLEVLASFPDPVGPAARDLYWRYGDSRMAIDFGGSLQTVLLVVGVLLFISGTGIALFGPNIASIGDAPDTGGFVNGTTGDHLTPGLTATLTPTPEDGGGTPSSSPKTGTPTAEPPGPTPTRTSTGPPTEPDPTERPPPDTPTEHDPTTTQETTTTETPTTTETTTGATTTETTTTPTTTETTTTAETTTQETTTETTVEPTTTPEPTTTEATTTPEPTTTPTTTEQTTTQTTTQEPTTTPEPTTTEPTTTEETTTAEPTTQETTTAEPTPTAEPTTQGTAG